MLAERSDIKSYVKLDVFRFKRPTCLATLKSSDRTKQFVCGWQYVYLFIYIGSKEILKLVFRFL